ncbi:MAG: hypothetical protein ACE5IR_07540 [bacterium]
MISGLSCYHVKNITEIEETEVAMYGDQDAKMRVLISDKDGADNVAMRMFTVERRSHAIPFSHLRARASNSTT